MAYSKIEEQTEKLAGEIIKNLGYEIYNIEYVKEGSHWFLRLYVDRDSGVLLDDCEVISKQLSVALDTADFIRNNYFLEVSSPGIERSLVHLWHYEKYIGRKISVKLQKKGLVGILQSVDNGVILVGDMSININDIKHAHLVWEKE